MVYEDFFLGSAHEAIKVRCKKCGKGFEEVIETDYKDKAMENGFFCSPRCASK